MKSIYFLFLLFAFSQLCFSQNTKALKYYNDAVELYNQKDYEKANDLFTKSLELEKNRDTYFSRALCQGKIANKSGYCEDLVQASIDGHSDATGLFLKSCGKIDTSYSKLEQNYTETVILSRIITYSITDGHTFEFKQKYASQQSTSGGVNSAPAAQVFTVVESNAEFPGGFPALLLFIQNNIKLSPHIMEGGGKRKTFTKFTVFEDGTIHDITIAKGALGCAECDIEATRLIAIMPRWKPAYFEGHPVKCYFNFPISFTFNR